MRASDLKDQLIRSRDGLPSDGHADMAMALEAIIRAVALFEDRAASEFLTKLSKIKPNKTAAKTTGTSKAPKLPVVVRQGVVDSYVRELNDMMGDHKLVLEVLAKLKSDKRARKEEAVLIAAALGISAKSKTLAFQQIEGASSRTQRERFISDQIRKGA